MICWAWFEEAFQIESEEDFDKVDKSIRGTLTGDALDKDFERQKKEVFKQITMTMNPWSSNWWGKKRFFDRCINTDIQLSELEEYEKGKRKYINKFSVNKEKSIFVGTTTYACNEFLDDDDRRMFEETKERSPISFNIEGLRKLGNK